MEDPIGVPYGGPYSSACPKLECPIGGPYCMQRALLRAPHVEHSLENSRGPNLKGKQKNPKGKTPLFQNVIKNRIIPIFVGAIFNNVLV